jgi:hypothetical protein
VTLNSPLSVDSRRLCRRERRRQQHADGGSDDAGTYHRLADHGIRVSLNHLRLPFAMSFHIRVALASPVRTQAVYRARGDGEVEHVRVDRHQASACALAAGCRTTLREILEHLVSQAEHRVLSEVRRCGLPPSCCGLRSQGRWTPCPWVYPRSPCARAGACCARGRGEGSRA